MNRRQHLCEWVAWGLPGAASASPMDWWNDVQLGAVLPAFDAEYIGAAPPDAVCERGRCAGMGTLRILDR